MDMGLVSLPFAIARIISCDMEVITGGRKRLSNTFFWDLVIKNRHGNTSYDANISRLYRWDSIQGVINATYKTYVDDLRSIAATQ